MNTEDVLSLVPQVPRMPPRPRKVKKGSSRQGLSSLPPLTRSEQLRRIQDWTKATSQNLEKEFEAETSQMIYEGVQKLMNWDKHIKQEFPPNISEIISRSRSDDEQISEDQRRLIEDMKKTKQPGTSKDKAQAKLIVKEFQQFMENKKRLKATNANMFSGSILTKTDNNSGQNDTKLPHRPLDFRKELPGALHVPYTRPSKIKRVTNTDGQALEKKPPIAHITKAPEYWRRKIRQGIMQTDELVQKLVDQSRGEERDYDFPRYSYKYPLINTKYPTPRDFIGGGASSAKQVELEREQLSDALEKAKRLHKQCFGKICDTKTADNNKENVDDKRRSDVDGNCPMCHQQKQVEEFDVLHQAIERSEESQTKRSKKRGKSKHNNTHGAKANSSKSTAKSTDTDKIMKIFKTPLKAGPTPIQSPRMEREKTTPQAGKEFTVLFDRMPSTASPQEGSNQDDIDDDVLSDRSEFKSRSIMNKYEALLKLKSLQDKKSSVKSYVKEEQHSDSVPGYFDLAKQEPKAMVGMEIPKVQSEWKRKVRDIKARKAAKNAAEEHRTVEQRKYATNALYHELIQNKLRLESEVDSEKRKMQHEWKFRIQNHRSRKGADHVLAVEHRSPAATPDRSPPRRKPIVQMPFRKKLIPKTTGQLLEDILSKARDKKSQRFNMDSEDRFPSESPESVPLEAYPHPF